jgi:hypothetical protein
LANDDKHFPDFVGLNSVPVNMRPTNLVDLKIGQTDAGQLDAFNKTEHIRPDNNVHANSFAEKKKWHFYYTDFCLFSNVITISKYDIRDLWFELL